MPPTTAKRPVKPPRQTNTGVIVVVAVAVVAVLAIVIGVVSQIGKSSGAAGLSQTQPVTVTGTSLPPLPSDAATADTAIGTVPPKLSGKSFDGTPIVIDPADGKPKLVVFGAHWCPHCRAEFPRLVQWQQAGKIPAGIEVYGVATGTSSSQVNYPPSAWLQSVGWTNPTMADSQDDVAADAWGLQAYPYFVALDGSGKVVARVSGELTEDQFTQLLAQIAPS